MPPDLTPEVAKDTKGSEGISNPLRARVSRAPLDRYLIAFMPPAMTASNGTSVFGT